MPGMQHGSTVITAIQHGSTIITSGQHGSTIVWSPISVGDDFERDNGALGSNWTDLGASTDWKLGIQDGRARVLIPDGTLGGFWDFRSSAYRYNAAVNPADDGFVECRWATQGDPASFTSLGGYHSYIYGRAQNSGATNNGVGIHAAGGHLWIARRVSATNADMVDGGTFQSGDVTRLAFAGNLHILYKNGVEAARWNDSGATASKGSTLRSLFIGGAGAKDLLGPRRFSPTFDYVKMG